MELLTRELKYIKQLQEEFGEEPHADEIIAAAARLYAMNRFYDKADICSFFPDAMEVAEEEFEIYCEERLDVSRKLNTGSDKEDDSTTQEYIEKNQKELWTAFASSGRLHEALAKDIIYWSRFYSGDE